jgi:hypothetical protein
MSEVKKRIPKKKEIQLTRVEKTIVTKSVAGREWIVRSFIWEFIPNELKITPETPEGVRVVAAPSPETRFYLVQYLSVDPFHPNGGIAVKEAGEPALRYFTNAAVVLHNDKAGYVPVPDEFKYFTGGHREGTQAAENAARKEMKKQVRREKKEKDHNDKEAAKAVKKSAKVKTKSNKK